VIAGVCVLRDVDSGSRNRVECFRSCRIQRLGHRLVQELESHRKEGATVEEILGWGSAGGLGLFLAGLGVFFWGLQFVRREHLQGSRWTKKE